MTLDVFWQRIESAIMDYGECDVCPVNEYAKETNTERMCDKVCDCADGLKMLHKMLQGEELKMIKREKSKRKKSMYRFWVCKHGNQKLNEFIPVTDPFYKLNEANEWMIKHSSGTDEILYAIRVDKDMWDDEDIERMERESNAD
jgi:hypothetical protein